MFSFGKFNFLLVLLSLVHLKFVYSWFEYCDHKLNLDSGKSVFIVSPYYPLKYPTGSSCRYTIKAPLDHQLKFNCTLEFYRRRNTCTTELFYFNAEGSKTEDDSEYFCGNGTFIRKSFSNQASIFYKSSSKNEISKNNKRNGLFNCLIQAIPQNECNCGWSNTGGKIVGGIETSINEFPSMAGIMYFDEKKIFCGATIIHHRYLLSAAHCFIKSGINDLEKLRVVVGEHDTETKLESPFTDLYFIEKIILHENFDRRILYNDIALIHTRKPIQWYNAVGPACLPFNFNENYFIGKKLDIAGWGTTSFGGYQSTKLLKTTLDVIDYEKCSKSVTLLQKYQFCTYTDFTDACQYDSGGALYWRQQYNYAIGIVSYGFACASKIPSVNTEIVPYLKWMEINSKDASFCKK